MYCDPSYGGAPPLAMPAGTLSGVTAVRAGTVNGGGVNPCNDTLYRMTHQAQCAAAGVPSSAPPPPAPTYTPPPSPGQGLAPVVQTFDVPEYEAPEAADTTGAAGGGLQLTIEGAGGGGAGASPVDVQVTTPEEPGRGFGLVEAALAAGLAFLVASAWGDRKRRRR